MERRYTAFCAEMVVEPSSSLEQGSLPQALNHFIKAQGDKSMSGNWEDYVIAEVEVQFTRTLEISGILEIEVPSSVANDPDKLHSHVEENELWQDLDNLHYEDEQIDSVELIEIFNDEDD